MWCGELESAENDHVAMIRVETTEVEKVKKLTKRPLLAELQEDNKLWTQRGTLFPQSVDRSIVIAGRVSTKMHLLVLNITLNGHPKTYPSLIGLHYHFFGCTRSQLYDDEKQ